MAGGVRAMECGTYKTQEKTGSGCEHLENPSSCCGNLDHDENTNYLHENRE
jgi:hypothetical protein